MIGFIGQFWPQMLVAVIAAFVLNEAFQAGRKYEAAICITANKAATEKKNDELAKAVEELRDLETRETEAAEKAGEVLILNPAPEDTCRLATPEEEQAFDQLGGNL